MPLKAFLWRKNNPTGDFAYVENVEPECGGLGLQCCGRGVLSEYVHDMVAHCTKITVVNRTTQQVSNDLWAAITRSPLQMVFLASP